MAIGSHFVVEYILTGKTYFVSTSGTVLARIYAPPFCVVVRQKRRRGGRLIEICTNAPSLRPPPPPPHPTLQTGFRVTVSAAHTESRGCHKITIIIVHNNQQLQTRDGRIVGHVPLELARTSWYTARLPAE